MQPNEAFTTVSKACFSDCGRYRYWLSRIWDEEKPIGAFICMNPSTASSLKFDPTVMNINNLAVDWGWGGFYVLNLSAFRETDSSLMGPLMSQAQEAENDKAIQWVASQVSILVAAWGGDYHTSARSLEVQKLLSGYKLHCIDHLSTGAPLHPVNVSRSSKQFAQPIIF